MIALIKNVLKFLFVLLLILITYTTEKKILKKRQGTFRPVETKIPLPSKLLKILALNNDLILADLFYIKSLLYTGEYLNTQDTYWLYTYFDTITDLDPVFQYAYISGGITLSVFCYNGELSNRILLKGYNHFKDDWRIPFLIGYNYYYELGNFVEGAKFIEVASRVNGAPFWLSLLAAKLYSSAGNIDYAIEFLKNMISITQDKKVRKGLQLKLKAAILEKTIMPLETIVERYKKIYGRYPDNLNELVEKGLIERLPEEPFGGYFYIDKDGTIWSSSVKERFKLHIPEDLGWKLQKRSEYQWRQ